MAALNTNLEVSLWGPSKNYMTGEWYKVGRVFVEVVGHN